MGIKNVEFAIENNALKEIKINPDFKDKEIIEIVLPYTVKTIKTGAFTEICGESSPVITIIAPEVETIEIMAFYKCQSLKSITAPKVKTIEEHAFNSCESLESIQIIDVETIESEAFKNCSKLKSIELPSSVNISDDSFDYCDALNHVKIRYNIDKSIYYVHVDKSTSDKKEVTFEYRSNLVSKQIGDIQLLLNKIFVNEITKENLKYKGNIMNSLRSLSKKNNDLDKKLPDDLFRKIMEYDGYKPRRTMKKKSRRKKSRRKSNMKRSNKKKKSKRRNYVNKKRS